MKTSEQVAAEVFARRDAYLAERAEKRRAAKKYSAAALLVFAAVFAAAGLYRSGWPGTVPPVSLYGNTSVDDGTSAFTEPSGDLSATRNTADGTAPQQPSGAPQTTGSAADATRETRLPPQEGPTSAAGNGTAEAVTRGQEPSSPAQTAPRSDPPTGPADIRSGEPAEPAVTRRPAPATEPTDRVREPGTAQPTDNLPPTADDPEDTPAPSSEPDTTPREPGTEQPSDQLLPNNGKGTEDPSFPAEHSGGDPKDVTPVPQSGSEASLKGDPRSLYVLYDGAVYAAESVSPTPVPAGAKELEQKDAIVEGPAITDEALEGRYNSSPAGDAPRTDPAEEPPGPGEESEPSAERARITLLSLPPQYTDLQLGVTVEGSDGMYTVEYVCEAEDLP